MPKVELLHLQQRQVWGLWLWAGGCPYILKISFELLRSRIACTTIKWACMQIFRPITLYLADCTTLLVFGPYRGETGQNRWKICNFTKLSWYSPKNENAWPKCLPHHFGGCFVRFSESVFRFGRSKCQKMAVRAAKFKNGLRKSYETPPKMVG